MKRQLTIILFCFLFPACMDPRPDYQECVKIETARCDVRQACMGKKSFDEAYPDFDRDTCIAYSKEHCRTREIKGEKWGQKDVGACVEAILYLENNCKALIPKGEDETESIGQCNFIDNGDAGLLKIEKSNENKTDTDTDTDDTNTEPKETDSDPDIKDAGA